MGLYVVSLSKVTGTKPSNHSEPEKYSHKQAEGPRFGHSSYLYKKRADATMINLCGVEGTISIEAVVAIVIIDYDLPKAVSVPDGHCSSNELK